MTPSRQAWKQDNSIKFAGTALSADRIYQLLGDAMAFADAEAVAAAKAAIAEAPPRQGGGERMQQIYEHDFPKLLDFFNKWAIGEKGSVLSCLCCGQEIVGEPAVSHLELAGIAICATCKTATTTPAPLVMSGLLTKYYSGKNSEAFWVAIRSLYPTNRHAYDNLYAKGIELQRKENEMLSALRIVRKACVVSTPPATAQGGG